MDVTLAITDPQISWEEIAAMFPALQVRPVANPVTLPQFESISVEYDLATSEWIVNTTDIGRDIAIPHVAPRGIELLERILRQVVMENYQPLLETAAREFFQDVLSVIAKQVPYPHECTCENDDGLVSRDCHVHAEDPTHVIYGIEFECTCP